MFDFTHLPRALLFLALAVILVVAPLVSALLAKRTVVLTPRGKHARYARTLFILWSITALALYALRLHGQSLADIGFVPPREPAAEPYIFVLVLVAFIALAGLRARPVDPEYLDRMRRIAPLSAADWAWFVPLAFSAGLCEEFLYRGYAITVLATMTGSVAFGVVISTAAFGLAHAYQGRRGVLGTTIFGLYFALVFVVWGSLWPCIVGHVLQDLVGGMMVSRRIAALPPATPSESVAALESAAQELAPPESLASPAPEEPTA